MDPIVLASASGSLTFERAPQAVGDWCQVHLLAAGERRPLGAESLQPLVRRLAAFLGDVSPGKRWVFSLSELHTSAYGEHLVDRVVIAFQDRDAKFFAELALAPFEVERWQLALAAVAARDHRAR